MSFSNRMLSAFLLAFWLLFLGGCVTNPTIQHAAFIGDLDTVKKGLAAGEDVNKPDPNGWTPIFSAVSEGHKDVIVYLINNGANIDRIDNNGWSVLDEARFQGREEIITLLKDEQTRRNNRYRGAVEHFGSLVMSKTQSPVFSEWFQKYPLYARPFWNDPFRAINTYVKETEIKYLASADYHGSRYGLKDENVQPVQGRFESDRSYQIRLDEIAFEQTERRKQLAEARRLMIADAVQWVMGGFALENPRYNRSKALMEFDLVSTRANFRQRIGAPLNDSKLAQSIYYNPGKSNIFVLFLIKEKSYQLHGVEIRHQGSMLNAAPIDNAVYKLSI